MATTSVQKLCFAACACLALIASGIPNSRSAEVGQMLLDAYVDYPGLEFGIGKHARSESGAASLSLSNSKRYTTLYEYVPVGNNSYETVGHFNAGNALATLVASNQVSVNGGISGFSSWRLTASTTGPANYFRPWNMYVYTEVDLKTGLGGNLQFTETSFDGAISAGESWMSAGDQFITIGGPPPSPFHDFEVHGGSSIDIRAQYEWTFTEEDPWAIVRRKQSWTFPDKDKKAQAMEVTFHPMNSHGEAVSLSALASALGFNHFNWHQKIIGLPGAFISNGNRFTKWTDVGDLPNGFSTTGSVPLHPNGSAIHMVEPLTVPFDDPPPKSTETYALYNEAAKKWGTFGKFDDYPYYLDEVDSGNSVFRLGVDLNNRKYTDVSSLLFEDQPGNGGIPLNGGKLMFSTELVGVNDDGTEFPLGVGFNWASDAEYATESFQFGLFAHASVPLAPISGGVSDVETFGIGVPEPFGLVLLLTVFWAMIGAGRPSRAPK